MRLTDRASFLQTIWYFEAFPVAESHLLPSHGNQTAAETPADEHMAIFYSLSVFQGC